MIKQNMDIKDKLIAETTVCDFKRNVERNQPKSWLKSVSAFANSIGGSLFFGVDDDGVAIGLENIKSDSEFISERIKVVLDPIPDFELCVHQIENKQSILELKVQAGAMTPYYYFNSGSRIAFVRIGNESVAANASQLNGLVLKGRNVTYDSLITEYTKEQLSFRLLAQTYTKQTQQPFDEKLLVSFALVSLDNQVTNAGLLFADDCPLKHSRIFCTRWDGLFKDNALDDKEFQGNLIDLLRQGFEFITTHSQKGWNKVADRRINKPDYADRAIFEALVNALIHRDYTILGSEVHIDMYDDRLMIYSPGGMFDGTLIQNRNIDLVPSSSRNPIIADVFSQLDYMEKRGSGLRKICNESAKLTGYNKEREPLFISEATAFCTEIKNVNYSLVTEQVPNKYRTSTDQVTSEIKLLLITLQNKTLSVRELMELLSLKHRPSFLDLYLSPSLEKEYIAMIYPDNPNHPKQKYKLTKKGENLIDSL